MTRHTRIVWLVAGLAVVLGIATWAMFSAIATRDVDAAIDRVRATSGAHERLTLAKRMVRHFGSDAIWNRFQGDDEVDEAEAFLVLAAYQSGDSRFARHTEMVSRQEGVAGKIAAAMLRGR